MSATSLTVEKRDETGTLRIRRMRKAGKIPAVLYGHGQDAVNLSIDVKDVNKTVHAGQYVVTLSGAVTDTAVIKDVQWNAFGTEVLHMDFARVDAAEAIEVTLPLTVKGTAPGVVLGGMVVQLVHEIKILCPANAVPESLEVNIDTLELGGVVPASAIQLPPSASLVNDANDGVVSCNEPRGAKSQDDDADADAPAADAGGDAGGAENND